VKFRKVRFCGYDTRPRGEVSSRARSSRRRASSSFAPWVGEVGELFCSSIFERGVVALG